ncbi:MAG: hypothetical protein ACO35B_06420 [Luminiphilus sp.]
MNGKWERVPNFTPFSWRSYGMFGFLADVRNYSAEAFEAIEKRHKKLPWIHMLRGLQLAGTQYPFASADSTNVGRNHHRHECVVSFARAIDAKQTPRKWKEWRVEKVDEADGGSATEISRGQYPVEQNGPDTVDGV